MRQFGIIFVVAMVFCSLSASEGDKKGAVAGKRIYVFRKVKDIEHRLQRYAEGSVVEAFSMSKEHRLQSHAAGSVAEAFSMSKEEMRLLATKLAGKEIPEDQLTDIANKFVKKNNKTVTFLEDYRDQISHEEREKMLVMIARSVELRIIHASDHQYLSKGSDGASSVISSLGAGAGAE